MLLDYFNGNFRAFNNNKESILFIIEKLLNIYKGAFSD